MIQNSKSTKDYTVEKKNVSLSCGFPSYKQQYHLSFCVSFLGKKIYVHVYIYIYIHSFFI